jgi:hypothetical protein
VQSGQNQPDTEQQDRIEDGHQAKSSSSEEEEEGESEEFQPGLPSFYAEFRDPEQIGAGVLKLSANGGRSAEIEKLLTGLTEEQKTVGKFTV